MMHREIVLHVGVRRIVVGVACGLAALYLLGAAAPGPEAIRVRQIDVVDGAGRTLIRIGSTNDGRSGLFILGADGNIRAAMQVETQGAQAAGVAVFGKDSSNFVALTAKKEAEGVNGSAVTVGSTFGTAFVASSPSRNGMLGFSAQRTAPAKGEVNLSVLGTGDAGLKIVDDRGRMRAMPAD